MAVPLTAGPEFSSAAEQPEVALWIFELLLVKFNEQKGCSDFPLYCYVTMLTYRKMMWQQLSSTAEVHNLVSVDGVKTSRLKYQTKLCQVSNDVSVKLGLWFCSMILSFEKEMNLVLLGVMNLPRGINKERMCPLGCLGHLNRPVAHVGQV